MTSFGRLPYQLTGFVGREREIGTLLEAMRSTRLLTLTGAAGSGKTRLALELAVRSASIYQDGVYWVELAGLSNPDLLTEDIAAGLGIRVGTDRPAIEALVDALCGRSVLLALDNCEHIVDACARLVNELLLRCPTLHILATSRQRLSTAGETAWPVPGLSLPAVGSSAGADDAGRFEAVRLFVERAQSVQPDFGLSADNVDDVVHICHRLNGMPLAIELAAARISLLTPAQIRERLDDLFGLLSRGRRTALPHHRTLRATLDWSYALLTEEERVLLRRFAVFSGTFSLEAVESVCAVAPLEMDGILDVFASLVDKSLVVMEAQHGEARYWLLEAVQQYAHALLQEAGEEEVMRERHAACYLALAEAVEPGIFISAAYRETILGLEAELGNLRRAADWYARDAKGAEGALRLATALHWFWFARVGYFREGRARIEEALREPIEVEPLVRGRALTALGHLTFWQGDHAAMRAPLEEAVAILRGQDDLRSLAYALVGLGMALMLAGDLAAAEPLLDEAVRLTRRIEPKVLTAFALYWLGHAVHARGDLTGAAALYDEAIAVGRSQRHLPATAHPLTARALAAFHQDDHETARTCFAEAWALHLEMEDRWGLIHVLEGVAAIAAGHGEAERAATLLGASEALCRGFGVLLPVELHDLHDRAVQRVRVDLGEAKMDEVWSAGRTAPLDQLPVVRGAAAPAVVRPPDSQPTASIDVETPALRIRALGNLEVLVDGHPIDHQAWHHSRPRELLLLLACHPRGCTRSQVGLAFWRDSSTSDIKNRFHVTLHHLRKALGRADWIVIEDDRYLINSQRGYAFDVAEFEGRMKAALRTDPAEGTATLESALALYRGEFLESEAFGDWHLEHRDRLRRLHVKGLAALGERLLAAADYARALSLWSRVVLLEELDEAAHRQLMICHARLGDRTRAMRQYERLAALLRDELDTSPDSETTALYERLRRAEQV